ncbi:MAG: hypothetical protein DSY90_00465 [Deltaproteobacteria bacterium]|nr:MAG: hypothetical protein DSY90_00465 [Deltaproteobacteria bacterium]
MVLICETKSLHFFPRFRVMATIVTLWLLLFFSGCQPDDPRSIEPAPRSITTEFNGFTIPVYPTATEQLAYAKSRFANTKEKEAALKLVLKRFPQDMNASALARLDLAYLALGADYRLADQTACRRALAQYHQITRTYAGLKGVCAKAYWHMAWIYTDLLGEKRRGIAIYRQVASQFPSELITVESPASWLQLMYPERPDQALVTDDRQLNSWSELARLEIIKNEDDPVQRRQVLMTLCSRNRTGPATGLALLSVLNSSHSNIDDAIFRIARKYIQRGIANKMLVRDIETALAQCRPGGPEK